MTVANLTKDRAPRQGADNNPLGIRGIDHIEFYVDNADEWANYHEKRLGMYRRAFGDASTGLEGRKSYVVGQGRVNFVFTEPVGQGAIADEIRAHVEKHGNGVKDVSFRVRDVKNAMEGARRAGAKVIKDPTEKDGYAHGAVAAYGDTIHSFVARTNHGQYAPGYQNMPGGIEEGEITFMMIDHVVANVENMNQWVDFYGKIFGFDETRHFDINTGKSALMSKVVGQNEGYIKLPINEPSSENSQIQEFIDEYKGPGVQHIALLTPDIVATVRAMRETGMDFLNVPDTYYEDVPKRCGKIQEDLNQLRELRVLVDRDREDGYLLQLFSKPIFDRPTLFYEVIQRRGNSDGFGEGNFRALFEAIEREQEKRGSL